VFLEEGSNVKNFEKKMEILFPNDLDTVNNPCHFENFILKCTATPY